MKFNGDSRFYSRLELSIKTTILELKKVIFFTSIDMERDASSHNSLPKTTGIHLGASKIFTAFTK